MDKEMLDSKDQRDRNASAKSPKGTNFVNKRVLIPLLVLGVAVLSTLAFGATIPNSFSSGDVILSSHFNDNFSYIVSRLWDLSGSDLYYNSGNVGIGTSTPTEMLDVNGGIKVGTTINTCQAENEGTMRYDSTNKVMEFCDATSWKPMGSPSDTIAYFPNTSCPYGWSVYASAEGRVILTMPSGGTAEGTLGTALTNLGTRTITSTASHSHGVGSLATAAAGSHSHANAYNTYLEYALAPAGVAITGQYVRSHATAQTAAGNHAHSVSGSTAAAGSASVDVSMPYIQLLTCKKD